LFCFFIIRLTVAQNLVQNYSFEQYDTCPDMGDQIGYAIGWSKFSSTGSTPDYYNSCSSSNAMGVPQSFYCYQAAHRNCNAYAGIVTWSTVTNSREFIGNQLSQPLVVGQKYYLSFYTVMGEYTSSGSQYGLPSNNIGLRLSTVPYNGEMPCPIDNWAHLHSSAIISDSTNWTIVSGSIIADSAYQYVIVGNFFDDNHTDTMRYVCASCFNIASYYLIDDICVSTDSSLSNGGINTISCTTAVTETKDGTFNIFPNPVKSELTINSINYLINDVSIYNMYGEIVYSNLELRGKNVLIINCDMLKNGIYIVRINAQQGENYYVKKIIKN